MIDQTPKTARQVAALTLFSMEEDGAWSDGALHRYLELAGLGARDRALAARLTYGVIQNRLLCDWYLRSFSKVRLSKLDRRVRTCLHLGLYQLILTDRIPAHAAVDETVDLIRRFTNAAPRTIGYANGVLRAAARAVGQNTLPRLDCPDKESYYSLQYSHPAWLVRELLAQYGLQTTRRILEANNQTPPISVRVNRLKMQPADAMAALTADGMHVTPHPQMENILLVEAGDVASHPLFRQGCLTVQDAASALCAALAAPTPGSRVLDCCAAPGGKSFCLAEQMEDRGELISCDIYPHKCEKIAQGAARLDLHCIHPTVQDAAVFRPDWKESADTVLCDVPCSGMGIIRKKPEIRYKDPEPLADLPALQLAILQNCAQYVRPGGTLVYSTCTILEQENQAVVRRFLEEHTEFTSCPIAHPVFGEAPDGMITLLPGIHMTDGFFIAKMRRQG